MKTSRQLGSAALRGTFIALAAAGVAPAIAQDAILGWSKSADNKITVVRMRDQAEVSIAPPPIPNGGLPATFDRGVARWRFQLQGETYLASSRAISGFQRGGKKVCLDRGKDGVALVVNAAGLCPE